MTTVKFNPSNTDFDIIDPMRHIGTVIELVEQLADLGMELLGESHAHFTGTRTYLALMWGDIILWDSECAYREDRDFGEEEFYEPSMELCLRILQDEADKMCKAFSQP